MGDSATRAAPGGRRDQVRQIRDFDPGSFDTRAGEGIISAFQPPDFNSNAAPPALASNRRASPISARSCQAGASRVTPMGMPFGNVAFGTATPQRSSRLAKYE